MMPPVDVPPILCDVSGLRIAYLLYNLKSRI
jgi:hypothetical protein